MTKRECRHCVCLVEGYKGEWICDEVNKEISLIEECPEVSDDTQSDLYGDRED
jgi:hypothetical protein